MFDEASTVELVAEMLVESMCVRTMVAAGNLDAGASMCPGKLFGSRHKQPTDAALAKSGRYNQARDATKESIGMKQWDAMKRGNASNTLR